MCRFRYLGNEYGVQGSRFGRDFGSSKNAPKCIAIHPQALIRHFGIIKTHKSLEKTIKNFNKSNKMLFFPYRTPHWAVALGCGDVHERCAMGRGHWAMVHGPEQ